MLRAVSLNARLGPGLRVVVCLAMGGGCVGIAQAAAGKQSRPGIGGVMLGMTPEQVINKLGKPALMDCGVSKSGKPIKSCSPSKAQGLAWGKAKNGEIKVLRWSVLFKKGKAVNIDTEVKSVKVSGVGTGSTYAQVRKAFPKGKEYCLPMGMPPAGNPDYSEDWDQVTKDVYMTFPSDLTSCPVPKASTVRDINVGAVDRSGQGSGTW